MSRSYRSIIFAVVGWLSLAASPQPQTKNSAKNSDTQSETGERPQPIVVAISKPIEFIHPPVEQPPCGPRQYGSQDDLCAQWKAADSAGDAAWWAMVGTFVAAVGTLGLYWQVYLTRKAVEDTGKATDAMLAANEIAKTTQRPWLGIENVEISCIWAHLHEDKIWLWIEANVCVRNSGETPALNVMFVNDAIQLSLFSKDIETAFFNSCLDRESAGQLNIAPNGAHVFPFNCMAKLPQDAGGVGKSEIGRASCRERVLWYV